MKRLRVFSVLAAMLLLVSLVLSACGDEAATATPVPPTDTPKPAATATTEALPTATTVTAAATATRAAAAPTSTTGASGGTEASGAEADTIKEVLSGAADYSSYHFEIEVKPSVYVTQPVQAEGDYEAPNLVYIKGTIGGQAFENIAIGDTVFEKNASGEWVKKEETTNASDPTAMFDPESIVSSGNPLANLGDLTTAISAYKDAGNVQMGGTTVKHYTFDFDLGAMASSEGMQGMDVSGLDLGDGGFYIDTNNKLLYGIDYNLNLSAIFELMARAFSALGGTPTPGGVAPTPIPRLDVDLEMRVTKQNDPSIKVPVTDEMRQMASEEPTSEPFVEDTPEAMDTPEEGETPEAVPTFEGLPHGDGQVHEGKLGEPVDVGWSRFTLDSVQRGAEGVIAPDAGKEYIIINVTIENVSADDPQTVSSALMLKLKDSTGQEIDQTFMANYTNQLDSQDTELAKGEKVSGEVAYEVDDGQTGLTLEFYPYPFFDETTLAKVSLDQ